MCHELHDLTKCHKVFTYTILCLRYKAALATVSVSRTERVTEMSQILYVHDPLFQKQIRNGAGTDTRICFVMECHKLMDSSKSHEFNMSSKYYKLFTFMLLSFKKTKQPWWMYVCRELNEPSKCHQVNK